MKKVTKLGSYCNNRANAGTFYWNLNNAASDRSWNVGGRLVNARFRRGFPRLFQYKSVFLKDRATWQNRQPPKGGS